MRINHNIAALNAYRNLSVNNENTSKSLEKLSSGLRINRAADDAAGLAISEKMRSQIRGLDMASRNAMDGISVVQTADGALNSTTEILQRMRELTVQAASDSNTDADRQNIQKEIDQLTTEVNRIGNSTEFNTKSLLNGSLSILTDSKEIKAGSINGSLGSAVSLDPKSVLAEGSYSVDITKSAGTPYQNTGTVTDTTNSASPLIVDAISTNNNSDVGLAAGNYQVALSTQDAKVTSGITTASGVDVLNNTAGNNPITIDANSLLTNGTYRVGVQKTTIYNAIQVNAGGISNILVDPANPATDGSYTISTEAAVQGNDANGSLLGSSAISNISIKAASNYSNASNYQIQVKDLGALSDSNGVYGENYEFDLTTTDNSTTPSTVTTVGKATASVSNTAGTTRIQLGDISFDVDNAEFSNSSLGGNAINLAIGNQVTVTQNGTGDTESTGFLTDDASASTQPFSFKDGGKLSLSVNDIKNAFVRGVSYSTTISRSNSWKVQMYEQDGTTARGNALTLTDTDVADPAKLTNIQIGQSGDGLLLDLDSSELQSMPTFTSSTVNFTVDNKTTTTAQVQDINGNAMGNTVALTGTTTGSIVDLGNNIKLTYDGSNPGTTVKPGTVSFTVKDVIPVSYQMSMKEDTNHDGIFETTVVPSQSFHPGDKVTLPGSGVEVQTSSSTTEADNATFEVTGGVTDHSAKLQIGANAGQTVSLDINDMRATALQLSTTQTSSDGSQTITLSNGNTQQVWYTTVAGASDGAPDNAPQYSLDVTSSDKAQAAMTVIDDAVQRVSSERARLGAIQNRLEYTVDNLKTMSENVTSSESRIRDVDMAEEMTNFTKNNILNQAAQAMLAQANQLPQGVLQLLK
jgi:flagellin